jgi:histidine triad (HIT) family protein
MTQQRYCVFCEIIAGREPATVHYQDEDVVVISNRLTWAPVMLLAIPKKHMTQSEMWSDSIMSRLGRALVIMGEKVCPGGYRMVSNIGRDAMQSQEHGHIHLLGGMSLGPYA